LPDTSPNAVKTGSVQVKYADGSERTLPIHGITQLQFLRLLDEVGVKSFDALKAAEPTLEMIRVMTRAVALALTFEKTQDLWNLERIEKSFADMEQICKAFLKCLELSPLPRALKDEGRKGRPVPRQGPYR
jgi:hypothetical protein